MVKHARTKKRRAGRTGKTKLKNRNYQFYKPTQINDETVRAQWNPRKSPAQNMATMGLQAAVNSAIDCRAAFALSHVPKAADDRKAIELFDIPESDGLHSADNITVLPGKTFAQRKLPVSIEDQKYIHKCLELHGDDYRGMMRDIRTNDMQHTDVKLKKMAARFYLLTKEQLRVEIPEKVRHLMACLK
ncbi:hypothetical protein ACHAW5_002145 [Stephanodiscus triporus]|uniref:Nucleolar protein 16 n=1 Tax=Stephanodiscus triporus TaxID=2934178 RepID=A0ABD3N9W5_9STRA